MACLFLRADKDDVMSREKNWNRLQSWFGAGKDSKKVIDRTQTVFAVVPEVVILMRRPGVIRWSWQLERSQPMSLRKVVRSIVAVALAILIDNSVAEAEPPPFLVLQTAAQESITAVAFSPDGSLIATNSFDGRLRIHDARSGQLLRALGADVERGGRGLAFTPDGKNIVCAGFHMDKLVRLWNAETGGLVRTYAGHNEIEAYAIAVSPDGRWLASAGTDKQILVWDLASAELKHRIADQPFPVTALAFSPDSSTLASGGGDKKIHLWDTASGRLQKSLEGHRDWISVLAYSSDGETLASGSCDWAYHRGRDVARFEGHDPGCESEWKLWSTASGELKRAETRNGRLLSLAFSRDNSSLACGIGNDVVLYDLHSEAAGRVVTSHDRAVTAVAFSTDGAAIVSGSHDRKVKRVSLAGKTDWHVPGYWEQVNSVAISRDGSLIATGSSDLRFADGMRNTKTTELGPGAVRIWDARRGRLLRRMGDPGEQIMAVAIAPDGRRVASGGARGSSHAVRLWNAETGAQIWAQNDHTADILVVAFTPDGSLLATASADGSVKLRNPETGSVTRSLPGHEGGATSLAFTADGDVLAAGAANGTAHLWKVATGEMVRSFGSKGILPFMSKERQRVFTSVALTADGAILVTCNGREGDLFDHRVIRIWNTRTGEVKRELTSPQTRGRFVAISPDGTILATNGEGKAINLWNLESGELLHKIPAHPHPPQSAAFSSDGQLLVSGADYRETKVWNVATGEMAARLVTFSESKPAALSDDWVAETSDGFYVCSPGIDRFLAWRVGEEFRTAGDLGEKLQRADQVEAALKLESPKPIAK
jgi:WD40 repeat protein